MTVDFLTLEDLLALAADLGVPAVRDLGLLDAAAKRPQTSLYGRDAYTGIHEKAAVLLESLTRNHALIDGNKRLGWLATYVFYALNDIRLDAPDDAAYDLVIAVSTGALAFTESAHRLEGWCR
ncbi:MAG TPA: type II toxin-antitoxin system death-on-curing family toxin [Rhodoglobus sp.]|nr:type II toxin-antitoxin system death-on-curing family toxin [Rhodoglobus sp.]